ncbi:MAG TPA: electron transfer flavoprotein subunit beta/FixA family protein [Armatimonadetes bacterium]|nr:electron transfer flavoprotein subunit beta/FixA family protein [Armatimonadota bacterium]
MHAVVCIKQVPDTTEVRIDPRTNTLQRKGVPSIVNPYDVHAVEEALRLKDRYGGKVTILSMGPSHAAEAVKRCISLGADEGILLCDRAFAGADTLATSLTLAQALRRIDAAEPIDLIFCGKQAIDGDTAQVGPGIATRLGVPLLTYVLQIEEVNWEQRYIVVQRKLEEGRERVQAPLPALLSVVKEINTVRYASLPHFMRGLRYEVEVWNREALELPPEWVGLKGSPTRVTKIFAPPTKPGGKIIAGDDPQRAAAQLVEELLQLEIKREV